MNYPGFMQLLLAWDGCFSREAQGIACGSSRGWVLPVILGDNFLSSAHIWGKGPLTEGDTAPGSVTSKLRQLSREWSL